MREEFNKGKEVIVGIMLGIVRQWLFGECFLNMGGDVEGFYDVDMSIVNIGVSVR